MELGDSIRHGTKWLMSGKILAQVLQFAFGIVLARLLMPEDFGMMVTMQIFTGVAGFFAGGGMGQAIIRAKHVENKHYDVVFTLQLIAGVLIYAFFFFISPWFADWFHTPLYRNLLRVSALTFLLRPLANINNAKLHRAMRFKETSIVQFICGLITGLFSIGMAFMGMGVWSLIYSGIIGSCLNVSLLFLAGRQRPNIGFNKQISLDLGLYGVKVTAGNIISYLNKQISNFMLSKFLGAAQVGLFNKANSLRFIPEDIIMGSAYQAIFRALSSLQDDKNKSLYIFYRSIGLLAVYSWPIYIGIWWVAEPLVLVLYGQKWGLAILPLQVLSLAGFIACIGYQCGGVIAAQNRLGKQLLIKIEQMILLIIGSYVGMNWGLCGVAWAIVVIRYCIDLQNFRLAAQCIDIKFMDLLISLKPAFILNAILFVELVIINALFNHFSIPKNGILYLFIMSGSGFALYSILFLYLPIKDLKIESDRWKKGIFAKFGTMKMGLTLNRKK